MSEPLPDPLVPPGVDLRDFGFMPLDVRTLLSSSLWIKAKKDPRVGHAAVSLWCEAWHQVPAGSLPDDDEVLAELARCDDKEWKRIRDRALAHFVKCSDGRLYHRHVAAKALESWESKLKQRERTKAANEARERARREREHARDVARNVARDVARDVERNEPRDEDRNDARDEIRDVHQGTGTVKGQGQGIKNDDDARAPAHEGAPARAHGSDPPVGAVVVDAAARSRRAIEIVAFCRRRSVAVTGTNPDVLAWAEEGFTDAQIGAAIDIAVEQRRAAGSMQAIGTKYLDPILRQGATPATARARRESTDEHNRREVEAWLHGQAAADAGRTIDA